MDVTLEGVVQTIAPSGDGITLFIAGEEVTLRTKTGPAQLTEFGLIPYVLALHGHHVRYEEIEREDERSQSWGSITVRRLSILTGPLKGYTFQDPPEKSIGPRPEEPLGFY